MIDIDGAMGEGGGQVLRSCLSLSLITGQAFNISNIRMGRKKPGLRAQHLASVMIAATVSRANVEGAEQNSTSLSFHLNRSSLEITAAILEQLAQLHWFCKLYTWL